jgi:hypothetical protein
MASMIYRPVLLLALAACAEGAPADDGVDAASQAPTVDAAPGDSDAPSAEMNDAAEPGDIDAAPGAPDAGPIDAAPPAPDASGPTPDAGCQIRDLLQNGNFDDAVLGAFWTEDANKALVTRSNTDPNVTAHSGTTRLLVGNANFVAEVAYQDVAVPAGTTSLVLAGFRETRSSEPGGSPFDASSIRVRSGSQTEDVATFSNVTKTTQWTAFSFPIRTVSAGSTVRIVIDAETDESYRTAFFYDSLTLTATICP